MSFLIRHYLLFNSFHLRHGWTTRATGVVTNSSIVLSNSDIRQSHPPAILVSFGSSLRPVSRVQAFIRRSILEDGFRALNAGRSRYSPMKTTSSRCSGARRHRLGPRRRRSGFVLASKHPVSGRARQDPMQPSRIATRRGYCKLQPSGPASFYPEQARSARTPTEARLSLVPRPSSLRLFHLPTSRTGLISYVGVNEIYVALPHTFMSQNTSSLALLTRRIVFMLHLSQDVESGHKRE